MNTTIFTRPRRLVSTLLKPFTVVCIVLPPVELLLIIWPFMAASVWRLLKFLQNGTRDPGFFYWGFNIKHLPYISGTWGGWEFTNWVLIFLLTLSFWGYVWYKLYRNPYSTFYKPAWWFLFGWFVIMCFSQF